jgi:3-isopropylmalate dehydrogenase
MRPEQGLLRIRKELGLFANLRPAMLYPELANASTLKPEVVSGLDILILRELTGDIYFGQPRGRRETEWRARRLRHHALPESEIRRIAQSASASPASAQAAVLGGQGERARDQHPVARSGGTKWRSDYPDVELSHMYVDNAPCSWCARPKQFDVIVTGNMFGDILSDEASMLTGSIGMLPSASLDATTRACTNRSTAPRRTSRGKNVANPLATILSLGMMMRYTFNRPKWRSHRGGGAARCCKARLSHGDIYEDGAQGRHRGNGRRGVAAR